MRKTPAEGDQQQNAKTQMRLKHEGLYGGRDNCNVVTLLLSLI